MKAKALNTKIITPQSAYIFRSNLNNKSRLIPLNIRSNDTGEVRYLPPVSKEWKNTIYSYYKNNMQSLPIDNLNANKIIRSYFNLYFKDGQFIDSIFVARKKRRFFLRKIYVSKMETKHTNSKAIITLYTTNIGKNILYQNYQDWSTYFIQKILSYWKDKLNERINMHIDSNVDSKNFVGASSEKLLLSKYKYLSESLKWSNLYLKLYLSRAMKFAYYNKLNLLRKYQLNYYLSKCKFEKNIYLYKLSNILAKIFNKNIEFNIINQKSITFNPDIFTEILSLKLRKPKSNVRVVMDSLLKKVKLPEVNRVKEKSIHIKSKDSALLDNKYKNLSLISILNKNTVAGDLETCSLNKLLKETYYTAQRSNLVDEAKSDNIKRNSTNISNIIFNSIKYKNLGGIRLEVKGRLTRRSRADRSLFRFKWKGSLKNIDSSYKKLPTVTYRGYQKPNVISSLSQSKRRVGAFAVKGWISGK